MFSPLICFLRHYCLCFNIRVLECCHQKIWRKFPLETFVTGGWTPGGYFWSEPWRWRYSIIQIFLSSPSHWTMYWSAASGITTLSQRALPTHLTSTSTADDLLIVFEIKARLEEKRNSKRFFIQITASHTANNKIKIENAIKKPLSHSLTHFLFRQLTLVFPGLQ